MSPTLVVERNKSLKLNVKSLIIKTKRLNYYKIKS